jgi:hypothetical protein
MSINNDSNFMNVLSNHFINNINILFSFSYKVTEVLIVINEVIVDRSCAAYHSMILTQNIELYV